MCMYRADWTYQRSSRLTLEGGGELRRSRASQFAQALELTRPQFAVRENFSAVNDGSHPLTCSRGCRRGAPSSRPGVRVDHSTLTGHTSASPWIETRWPLSGVLDRARRGSGIYRQEPDFAEVKGLRGADLDELRSYHFDAGVEGPLGRLDDVAGFRLQPRGSRLSLACPAPNSATIDGRLVLPSFTSQYENSLDGPLSRYRARRCSAARPNGLSGWIAYNLAFDAIPQHAHRRGLFRRLRPAAHAERVRRLPIQRSHELQRAFPRRQQLPCAWLLRIAP